MRYEDYWEEDGGRPSRRPMQRGWGTDFFVAFVLLLLMALVIISAPELYSYLARCDSRLEICP